MHRGARPTRDGIPASRFQLPPGPWTTVLDALCARFPQVGRETWLDRFARGRVLDAQGRPLDARGAFRAGAEIFYFREVADEPRVPFVETVLHADAHLVVVDKPHFLPVTPTGAYVRETLLTRLVQRFDNPALVPLHRIDRDTAGLVLFSADPGSRAAYQALFRERLIRKEYRALAPPLPQLRFPHLHRSRLERAEPFFLMREVAGAPNSETVIDVQARDADAWCYRLMPITGRKHQLRVHMAALGVPILNDPFYPRLREPLEDDHARPLQLFAEALEFDDPLTGERRRFSRGQGVAGDAPRSVP
ncbi:pseudouridylate synthase [Luteimonas yindakuii]|uniref:pseudouridine synthase n=1 Tax=Luteimonas yindakuii TaxID=2565782 RepID=UPI0010A551B6|nr:pseudouridine synthase [Luteimonas yindakuii]QCO68748.1 pseudouridylate synthase [Luteimonas yindakuii]